MKSRFIPGVSKAPTRTIAIENDDIGTMLRTPMSMTVRVDNTLPPNTIVVSNNWGQRDATMNMVDEALAAFLRTMGRMYNIQEITSDTAFKPVVSRNGNGVPQYASQRNGDVPWTDRRTDTERAFNVLEAQAFSSYLDMMAALRKRDGDEDDRKMSLSALRFDTLVRAFFPRSYNELAAAPNITSVHSRVAKMLGSRLARTDHQLRRDEISDRLVSRAIDLINKGQWGKF